MLDRVAVIDDIDILVQGHTRKINLWNGYEPPNCFVLGIFGGIPMSTGSTEEDAVELDS